MSVYFAGKGEGDSASGVSVPATSEATPRDNRPEDYPEAPAPAPRPPVIRGRGMTADAVPTSGVGRRRAKAIARRRHVEAQENDRRVAAGHLPLHWSSLDTCPCGRVSWLEDGATDEEAEAFYRDSEDHDSHCRVDDDEDAQ